MDCEIVNAKRFNTIFNDISDISWGPDLFEGDNELPEYSY